MTPEAKLKNDVVKLLKKLEKAGDRIWWVKLSGGPRQKTGLPDFAIVYFGFPVWIELKAPGEKPTPLQESTLNKIVKAGGDAEWFDEIGDVEIFLHELKGLYEQQRTNPVPVFRNP